MRNNILVLETDNSPILNWHADVVGIELRLIFVIGKESVFSSLIK